MHVKFLARGSGSAGAAAEYLLEGENAAGEEREEVEVLRGDPWQVADVADSLEFEYGYTSGVIAWAHEDDPSEDEIEQTLEEFERTARAPPREPPAHAQPQPPDEIILDLDATDGSLHGEQEECFCHGHHGVTSV